jgi:hypothetical protein
MSSQTNASLRHIGNSPCEKLMTCLHAACRTAKSESAESGFWFQKPTAGWSNNSERNGTQTHGGQINPAVMRDLPSFLLELLAAPPHAGEGVHDWLFCVARHLHAHMPAVEIVSLLQDHVADCGRHVPQNEILSAVQNSLPCAWQPKGQASPVTTAAQWPKVNAEQRAAVVRDGGGLVDLWETSRIWIESNEQKTEDIIDALFPGNVLLCCGKSSWDFNTRLREDWRGELAGLSLIVPSPMTAPTGLTKEGKESAHTLSNTSERRFLVCEFDSGTPDEHAALLLHLATFAPLVCAVHSGGKSLHGWFFVAGQCDDKILKFFRYAVSLGADRATWTRSQFVRMPDGIRANGNRQTVYFLNFKPMREIR